MKKLDCNFFPYGTQYHRAPTPLECEWNADMTEIAAQGYTHVQFRPQWRCHERIRGQYDFAELDRLLDEAHKHNLRVIVKIQLENAPDWVFTELSGSRIGFNGRTLPPMAHAAFYVGGWYPCFDNPLVTAAAGKFAENLARHVKDHPALWFFNAWNEPRSRPMGQCHCPHSIKSYQDFLREHYHTIENLNAVYGKSWTAFETVFPPHSHSDYVELFLWRQWAGESVARQVEFSAEAIRRGAPGKLVMCHVGMSSLVQDPAWDTSNDLLNCQKVDFYGCSFPIELHPGKDMDFYQPVIHSSWLRRVDKNYWCQEFYTNYANFTPEADPNYIEQAIWMAIASGCRGLTFWQYRSERFGEETNGWGMRNMDGSPTARSQRCDLVAGELRRWGNKLAATEVAPQDTAILFDQKNDLLMRIQEMKCTLDGISSISEDRNYSYKQSTMGSAYCLRKVGIGSDFVTSGQSLSSYRLVVVSGVDMLPESAVEELKKYVYNGGHLLIEYPFAGRDEKTWMALQRPAYELHELTGCREAHRLACERGEVKRIVYEDGQCDNAAICRGELQLISGEIKGRWENGSAAVIRNVYGRGTVWTCGGNLSAAASGSDGAVHLSVLLQQVLDEVGLQIGDSRLCCMERVSKEHIFRFIFNFTDEIVKVDIPEQFELQYCSCGVENTFGRLSMPGRSTVILRRDIQA